jgi:signal transduction histidine kinase/CheY-like chemotaxis protein
MKKRIPFQVNILLAILLSVGLVIASGRLAYKSLTNIVSSIIKETEPDKKLLLLNEILANLSYAESSVKTYSITKNETHLIPYYKAVLSIHSKIRELYNLSLKNTPAQLAIIDSVNALTEEKVEVLNTLINMNENNGVKDALNRLSKKIKTSPKEKGNKAEEDTFFSRLFKSKEDETAQPKMSREKMQQQISSVKEEIIKINKEEVIKEQETKRQRLELTEKDIEVMNKIRALVNSLELAEREAIIQKTKEAQKLAQKTNKIITSISIAISLLLFVIAYVIINYVRKSIAYSKALQHAKAKAEDLAKAKEGFLATMSHEIRTPLNAIIGFIEQLLKTSLEKEQRNQVEIIKRSSDHLLSVINDILDFSKLEAGKVKIEEIDFELKKVVEETLSYMKPLAEAKKIDLIYKPDKEIPEVIIGDPVKLKQILLNLMSNAIKFTEKGSVQIESFSIFDDDDNFRFKIRVSDTGIGIPKEKIASIFNEFEQADSSTTRKYGGTGLGLSITKKLIYLQKGEIEVDSEVSKGTTISITLPYRIGRKKEKKEKLKDTLINDRIFKNRSVLVADDNNLNRLLLTTILKKWNVTCTEAENGEQVLALLKNNTYDVILMDVQMPVMNGIEATIQIRKDVKSNSHNVPIIALTGNSSEEDRTECENAGMNEFISKPFKEQELYEKLTLVLNLKQPDLK